MASSCICLAPGIAACFFYANGCVCLFPGQMKFPCFLAIFAAIGRFAALLVCVIQKHGHEGIAVFILVGSQLAGKLKKNVPV